MAVTKLDRNPGTIVAPDTQVIELNLDVVSPPADAAYGSLKAFFTVSVGTWKICVGKAPADWTNSPSYTSTSVVPPLSFAPGQSIFLKPTTASDAIQVGA